MNKGDKHGSKQKRLVLQRGPHGATPLLASAVGTESLCYDHLTVRRGIEGFGRCLFRGGDDDCDKKHCCEDRFHFSLRNLSPSGKVGATVLRGKICQAPAAISALLAPRGRRRKATRCLLGAATS